MEGMKCVNCNEDLQTDEPHCASCKTAMNCEEGKCACTGCGSEVNTTEAKCDSCMTE